MPQVWTSLALGFLLGLKHAVEADHVVAVSAIVSQNRNLWRSSLVGIFWGIGHTATLFLAGLLVVFFEFRLPDRLALSMELLVGVILMLLGVSLIKSYVVHRVHLHQHGHGHENHLHFHSHRSTPLHQHEHEFRRHGKSLLVGMVHGLAGSAGLTLLVLTTISSPFQGLVYIGVFGAGSMMGMLLVSLLVGLPFLFTANFQRINETMKGLTGLVSVTLGTFIVVEIGFLQGLLLSFP